MHFAPVLSLTVLPKVKLADKRKNWINSHGRINVYIVSELRTEEKSEENIKFNIRTSDHYHLHQRVWNASLV